MKLQVPERAQMEAHYVHLASEPFFDDLVAFMSFSGPVCCMVWEGAVGIVAAGRVLLGATDPAKSVPGTIRGDYAVSVRKNVCHGSDSAESAAREIALWFPEGLA